MANLLRSCSKGITAHGDKCCQSSLNIRTICIRYAIVQHACKAATSEFNLSPGNIVQDDIQLSPQLWQNINEAWGCYTSHCICVLQRLSWVRRRCQYSQAVLC